MGENGERAIKEHVWRTYGQSQGMVGSRVGARDGWGGGVVVGEEWRQLYLNNNKKIIKKEKND